MSNNKDNSGPNITNNVLEVISAITRHDFVHIREISRLAGISPTTASAILKDLEESDILAKKVLGKNCFYSLNRNQESRKLLMMLECYKFLKSGVENDAEGIIAGINGIKDMIDCIILSKDNKNILFITSLDHDTINSALGNIKNKTRKMTILTRENFRNNLDNQMIKDMLADYIIISGAEKFIEMVH